MKRKILLIAICYLIGTVGGLYFNKGIILLFCIILFLCLYILNKKIHGSIICLLLITSSFISVNRLSSINKFYNINGEILVEGIVIDVSEDKNYNKILLDVCKFNKINIKSKIRFYIYAKSDCKLVKEGDYIQTYGELSEIQEDRNFGGFNYRKYLQSKQIFGIIKSDKIELKYNKKANLYNRILKSIRESIKEHLYRYLPRKNAELCIALILGEKSGVEDNIIKDFSDGGLSHILAISGMHVAYIASLAIFFSKKIFGKRKANYIAIIALAFFCNLVHCSESVFRATIMLSLYYIAKLLHKKSDSITNLSISTILSLILNPFCVYNTSFVMSSLGTLGIICFFKYINNKKLLNKALSYIKEQICLGISANFALIPICTIYFNKISFIFLVSSPIINLIITALMPTLIVFVVCGFFPQILKKLLSIIISKIVIMLTEILIFLASLFSKFEILNFRVKTPSAYTIIIYYFFFVVAYIKVTCNQLNQNIKKVTKAVFIIYVIICTISKMINLIDRNMKIHFVDQTTPNMIQRIIGIFERKPLISKEI